MLKTRAKLSDILNNTELSALQKTEHLFNVNESQGFFLGYLGAEFDLNVWS